MTWPFGPRARGKKRRTEVTGSGAQRAGQCVGSKQLQQVTEHGPRCGERGLGRVAGVTRCHHLSSPAGESTKSPSAANGLGVRDPQSPGGQARREGCSHMAGGLEGQWERGFTWLG